MPLELGLNLMKATGSQVVDTTRIYIYIYNDWMLNVI